MTKTNTPRDEVMDFMIELSEDANKREAFASNREAYLKRSKLTNKAKQIIMLANQRLVLAALKGKGVRLIFVIILETVTTDVIVALQHEAV